MPPRRLNRNDYPYLEGLLIELHSAGSIEVNNVSAFETYLTTVGDSDYIQSVTTAISEIISGKYTEESIRNYVAPVYWGGGISFFKALLENIDHFLHIYDLYSIEIDDYLNRTDLYRPGLAQRF